MAFPVFCPSEGGYPSLVEEASNLNNLDAQPTNSWFQNALLNNIADSARTVSVIPWYTQPSYCDKWLELSFSGQIPAVTVLSYGNILLQENASNTFRIESLDSIIVDSVSDLTINFKLCPTNGGEIIAYSFRGSPLSNFEYNNSCIDLTIGEGIMSLNPITNGYILESIGSQVSTVTQCMEFIPNGQYQTKDLSVYNGFEADPGCPVLVTLFEGILDVSIGAFNNLILNINNPTVHPVYPPEVQQFLDRSGCTYGFIITLTDQVLEVVVNIESYVCTVNKTLNNINRYWALFTSATLSTNVTQIQSAGPFNGLLQLAFLGSSLDGTNLASATTTASFFDPFLGGLISSGNVSGFTDNGMKTQFSYEYQWSGQGNNQILWYLPNHFNQFTLNTVNNESGPSFLSPSYGELNLISFDYTSPLTVESSMINIPLFQANVLSGLTSGQKNLLAIQVLSDAQGMVTYLTNNFNVFVGLNPYDFGQQSATIGRMITLAVDLFIGDTLVIQQLANLLFSALTEWFQGTNSPSGDVYQLQFEPEWKGIIVPADYLNSVGETNLTAYGNSFYNDHHFHYGYFFSAIAALEKFGLSLFDAFEDQINALLDDVINPVISSAGTKTRHKDWYAGHSWATGIVNSVNRQQESSGEAVNCYYSAYLLTFLTNNPRCDLAAVLLTLELASTNDYWYLLSPDAKIGDLTEVANVGMVTTQGKAYTLDWQMQPNCFPGRAIGLSGIQTIPFTEISPFHMPDEWLSCLPDASNNSGNPVDCNVVNPPYAIAPCLIIAMNGDGTPNYVPSTEQIIDPTNPPFNVITCGGYWGNVGMMILASVSDVGSKGPTQVTMADIETMWNSLSEKQNAVDGNPPGIPVSPTTLIKGFDSYSNTLLWLFARGKLSSLDFDTSTITVNNLNITSNYQNRNDLKSIKIDDGCKIITINTGPVGHYVSAIINGNAIEDLNLVEKALIHGVKLKDLLDYIVVKLSLIRLLTGYSSGKHLRRADHKNWLIKLKSKFGEVSIIDNDLHLLFY